MYELIRQETPIAQKDYICHASETLMQLPFEDWGLSFAEYREIVKAKRQKWKIKKGQRYNKYIGLYEGDFCVFRAIPAIDKIYNRVEAYDQ